MSKLNSLNKAERLKSVKITKDLFLSGQSVFQYPLKCMYMQVSQNLDQNDCPLLFSTTASKRSFKQAVKRNKIKRYIREAYRLNKAQLHETISSDHGQWAVMYIYVAKNIDDLNMIPKSMIKVNNKLLKVITSKS